MKALFLEGLESAREIVSTQGIQALDKLIEEHKAGAFNNARAVPKMETRTLIDVTLCCGGDCG